MLVLLLLLPLLLMLLVLAFKLEEHTSQHRNDDDWLAVGEMAVAQINSNPQRA